MASPQRDTVKLVSAEGFEFIIDYKAACVSNTIRNMLSSQGEHRRRAERRTPALASRGATRGALRRHHRFQRAARCSRRGVTAGGALGWGRAAVIAGGRPAARAAQAPAPAAAPALRPPGVH
jgi:hypothetical protein